MSGVQPGPGQPGESGGEGAGLVGHPRWMVPSDAPVVDESEPMEDLAERLNPEGLGRPPKHPRQDELDSIASEYLDDLFDALQSHFIYIGRRATERGDTPLKPSEVRDMLKWWDLDDAFEEWWHEGKTVGELEEEPWT